MPKGKNTGNGENVRLKEVIFSEFPKLKKIFHITTHKINNCKKMGVVGECWI